MGVFKDIMDTVKDMDIKEFVGKIASSRDRSTLSKMATEGTMQFPVIVSRSLDIDTLQMITKALERNFATFVEIVFSMNSTMNINDTKNPSDFIKLFHQNINNSNSISDIVDIGDYIVSLDNYTIYENENFILMSAVYEGSTGKIVAKNKEQLIDLMQYVKHDILNNKYVPKKEVIYNFKNKELSAKYNDVVMEARRFRVMSRDEAGTRTYYLNKKKHDEEKEYKENRDAILDKRAEDEIKYREKKDKENAEYREMQDTIKNSREDKRDRQNQINRQQDVDYRDKRDKVLDTRADTQLAMQKERDRQSFLSAQRNNPLYGNMLKDNDVKKANELVPTTLHIRLKQINEKNEDVGYIDFIVGVKATMHPAKQEEMISNIISACRNEDKAFNFFRWTSGEISFFKDFLFGVKGIKDDIINKSAGSSPWWITLKRRRALGKVKSALFMQKKVIPNTTIVLSMDEVDLIRSTYGFDIFSPIFVNKIMKTYFLLGLVIVDTSSQIAHFMFDGRNDFESISFSGLEKDNSASERKFKEMLKVINRN